MKKFLVVFQDLLTHEQNEAFVVQGIKKEDIIEKFYLKQGKNKTDVKEYYWCPDVASDVLIFIYEIKEINVDTVENFKKLVRNQHCQWY